MDGHPGIPVWTAVPRAAEVSARADPGLWRRPRRGSHLLVLLLLAAAAAAAATCAPRGGGDAATLRIYIARHGRTDWNAERRLQGQTDTQLDATGREQARQLAVMLQGIHLDAVYSSTLRRSRDTAETARGAAPLTSLDGLREQHLGKFEGLRLAGDDTAAVAEFQRRHADPDDTLDGGESASQFFARVQAAVQSIRARHAAGTVLIVGHGGTNQMIVRSLLELAPEQANTIRQANDEIYLVEIAPGRAAQLWKRITAANLGDL
jgi:broad specificity phosphatase PhoE